MPVNQRVYRFVEGGERDWQSLAERKASLADDCRAASLSCLVSKEDAEEAKALFERFKDAKIVAADLRPEHGRIKQTGRPPHHSLWLTREALATCSELFRVEQ